MENIIVEKIENRLQLDECVCVTGGYMRESRSSNMLNGMSAWVCPKRAPPWCSAMREQGKSVLCMFFRFVITFFCFFHFKSRAFLQAAPSKSPKCLCIYRFVRLYWCTFLFFINCFQLMLAYFHELNAILAASFMMFDWKQFFVTLYNVSIYSCMH